MSNSAFSQDSAFVVDATIVTTTDQTSDFPNSFSLGSLTTGLLLNTVSAGMATITKATQGVDYYAPGGTDVAVTDGGTGASNAATARTNLGLGTISTQNANAVAITGGTVTGLTTSSILDSIDQSHALGIVVGSDLTATRTLTLATGDNNRTLDISAANTTISTFGASLIDDSSATFARTTLGLGTISTQNANAVAITGGSITSLTTLSILDSIDQSHVLSIVVGSDLTGTRTLTLTTGDNNRTLDISAANTTISAFGATLVDDTDAATARTTLSAQQTISGLSIGAVTVATDDKILLQDTSNSDALGTATAQAVADLAINLTQADTAASANTTYTLVEATSNYHKVTFTSDCTLAFTFTSGAVQSMIIQLIDAGAYTVTFPTTLWAGGAAPTFTASGTDIIVVWHNGDNVVYGAVIGQDFS